METDEYRQVCLDDSDIERVALDDLRPVTFADAFVDVFTPPESLPLHQMDSGLEALVGDMWRIGKDCRSAAGKLGVG